MNFLNFLISLQIIFFLALPIASSSQPNKSQSTHAPKPIINQIASLPVGHFYGFNNFAAVNSSLIILQSNKTLWIYDGLNWESHSLQAKPIFARGKNNKFYISCKGNIELLSLTDDGLIKRSLIFSADTFDNVNEISSLLADDDGNIYFTSGVNLWYLSDSLTKIDSSNQWIRLVGNDHGILYIKDNHQLHLIAEEGSPPVIIEKATSNHPLGVFTISGERYIVTEGYPWITPVQMGNSQLIEQTQKLIGTDGVQIKSVRSNTERIYILTSSNKLIIWNKAKATIHSIDLNSHPSIDNIIDFYPYSSSSILAITQTELYSITPTCIAGVYADLNSNMGKPIAVVQNNGFIYYGTAEGIFAAKYNGDASALNFKKVERVLGQPVKLYNSQLGCFAVTQKGAYKLSYGSASEILPLTFDSNITIFESNGGVGIASTKDSLIFTQSIAPTVSTPTFIKIPANAQAIRTLVSYENNLIAQAETGAWYVYTAEASESEWQAIDFLIGEYGQVLFTTDQYSKPYIWEQGRLYPLNLEKLKREDPLISDSTISIIPLISTDSTLTALNTTIPFSEVSTIWRYGLGNKQCEASPLATYPTNESIKSSTYLDDGVLLAISSTGLHYFIPNVLNPQPPTVTISKFRLLGGIESFDIRSSIFEGATSNQQPHQSPHLRNVSVTFSTNISGNWEIASNHKQFSTHLNSFDNAWTPWTATNIREIHRLSPGNYTLRVKARNYWGMESDEASISFTIKPYFYEMPSFIIAFFLLGVLALYAFYKWRRCLHAKDRYKLETLINNRTEELVKEKEKTDNLLARVLPKETASELKEKGRVNTQRYQVVTVLFCDIEGFTKITDETNPEALIDQLDKFFLHFDTVVEKYRIEKIKTIGDAYMCAGGIPKKNRTNPVEVVLAALEMLQHMKDIMYQSPSEQRIWEIRIGIDTGPVIAGVVGRNKLSYDIWGSTVNTASRMESSGKAGQINISGNTFMLVSDYFDCTYRGSMPMKNKGDIKMYFVKGIKPKLSVDLNGIAPSKDFYVLLQLIRLGDLEDFVLEKLEKGLPKDLYYHNLKHTIDVYTQVELIGRSENVTNEELLLLRTAALFHDAGHLIDYDTHEEMAVKLAHEILPEYYYSEQQIEIISDIIMSTKLPPNPKNLLEEIICDADLDYLGRTDFIPVSNMLYRELHEHGKIGTLREWNELQIKFIAKHSYFTKTARKLRNVNKKSQLDKLKKWMEEN